MDWKKRIMVLIFILLIVAVGILIFASVTGEVEGVNRMSKIIFSIINKTQTFIDNFNQTFIDTFYFLRK